MLDTFDLETGVGRAGVERISIEDSIRGRSIFKEIVSELSNNEAPGPDRVNNELRKHLHPSIMNDSYPMQSPPNKTCTCCM